METLSTLLSAWHCWRSQYQYTFGYARPHAWSEETRADDEDEEIERCRIIEREIDALPRMEQMVLAELGRSEFLGVNCWQNPRLPRTEPERTRLEMQAMTNLRKRLLAVGILQAQNAQPVQ